MKQEIAKNKFYEIYIDKIKNRMYLKIKGFWRHKDDVANYTNDILRATASINSDFTLLADLSEMIAHPAEVQDIHIEAQQILISKGLLQTAEVYESSFVQFQTLKLSGKSKMPLHQFNNTEVAEKFLDSLKTKAIL